MLKFGGSPPECAGRRASGGCADCPARPFSICASVSDEDLGRLDAMAETIALPAGRILFQEGDPARHVFNVVSGSVRIYKLLADGRRQVTGFLFAGDFIGLGAGDSYGVSAEAIEASSLCRFRMGDYRALMAERRELESALLERAGRELAAAQDRMTVLGRKRALERLASFLVALPASDPLRPGLPGQVRLPMNRTEIADYLGLTVETVSRSFTQLKQRGLIRLLAVDLVQVEQPGRLRALAEGRALAPLP
jgi:CRP/FNR family transcriptional regulator